MKSLGQIAKKSFLEEEILHKIEEIILSKGIYIKQALREEIEWFCTNLGMNDYYFKICRFQGDFVWHTHSDTDEAFIVIEGEMKIFFRDGDATVCQGEMFVVPKNTEHKPFAEKECKIMLVEPMGTLNTGDNETSELTAEENVWI